MSERKGLPIGERAADCLVGHNDIGFPRDACNGITLNLIAVNRIRLGLPMRGGAGDAHTKQHGPQRFPWLRRSASTILEVAAGAGSLVEQRAETVPPGH